MKAIPPRHILFATDFTARCDRAQDRAVQLAIHWDARLTVVHALGPETMSPGAGQMEIPALIAREATLLREELSTVDGLVASVVVQRGIPRDVVAERMADDRADMIVTGISRTDGLGRAVVGSTPGILFKTCGVPVLVVKRKPVDAGGQIVFASDLSEDSARTLKLATGYFPKPEFTLFHAFDPPYANLAEDKASYLARFRTESAARCRQFLDRVLGSEAAGEVLVVSEPGEPVAALADYAMANDVDLVIAGSVERGVVVNMIVASVALNILGEVPCDVLVLPALRMT